MSWQTVYRLMRDVYTQREWAWHQVTNCRTVRKVRARVGQGTCGDEDEEGGEFHQ